MKSQRPGVMGQLSRIMMVMSSPFSDTPQSAGPPPQHGISLTNRNPSSLVHRLDLPSRDIASGQRSLSNLLSRGPPARPGVPASGTGIVSSGAPRSPPVTEIVRIYRTFLTGMLERHPDVKGVRLEAEICLALEEARQILPVEAKALIPAISALSEPGRAAGGAPPLPGWHALDGPSIETVRLAYRTVLQRILARLSPRVDPTILKLVFRLAARDALRDCRELVDRYSLMEGISDKYLRQVGP